MIKQRLRRLESIRDRCDLPARPKLPPRRLQTIQDVLELLQEQVDAVRANAWAGTLAKARTLGYLAGVARTTIAAGEVAARIDMLEAVLKERQGAAR
jgi:hypothetical protein